MLGLGVALGVLWVLQCRQSMRFKDEHPGGPSR